MFLSPPPPKSFHLFSFLFFLNLTLSLKDRQDECYDAYFKILDLKV